MSDLIVAECCSCNKPLTKEQKVMGWNEGPKGPGPKYLCAECHKEIGAEVWHWYINKHFKDEPDKEDIANIFKKRDKNA